eukprot:Filipodium_phascolosomae@DN213_c0_g1_i1.p1
MVALEEAIPAASEEELRQCAELVEELRGRLDQAECDIPKCKSLLSQLKIRTVHFGCASLILPSVLNPRELVIIRDMLELGVLLGIRTKDIRLFESSMTSLKPFYLDFEKDIPSSSRQYPMVGCYLLFLLTENRVGEFHTEVELWGVADKNLYVKYAMDLERLIMEGNYNKVVEAAKVVPLPYYSFFIDRLLKTLQTKIGEWLEKSYSKLPKASAARMLFLPSTEALVGFVHSFNAAKKARSAGQQTVVGGGGGALGPTMMMDADAMKAEDESMGLGGQQDLLEGGEGGGEESGVEVFWTLEPASGPSGYVVFTAPESSKHDLPSSLEMIQCAVGYATELERIV